MMDLEKRVGEIEQRLDELPVRFGDGDDSGFQAPAHFRVQSQGDDHVVAWRVKTDGTLINEDVLLAKPPSLRKTEYEAEVDGTITWSSVSVFQRTATDSADGSTEDQVIIPKYLPMSGAFDGAMVLAIRGISGGTQVTVGGNKLVWEIVDPRAFAEMSG